jgi:putative FmdB family regulatory protein
MPLYEYLCLDCGHVTEALVFGDEKPVCQGCAGDNLQKLMSTPSASSGLGSNRTLPGAGDTACCGSTPGRAPGCAGPGSCCGGH